MSQFLVSGIQEQLSFIVLPQGPHAVAMKLLAGSAVIWSFSWTGGSSSELIQVAVYLLSLASSPCRSLRRLPVYPHKMSTGFSQRRLCEREREREKERAPKMKAIVFSNLMLEVTYLHFGYILSVDIDKPWHSVGGDCRGFGSQEVMIVRSCLGSWLSQKYNWHIYLSTHSFKQLHCVMYFINRLLTMNMWDIS